MRHTPDPHEFPICRLAVLQHASDPVVAYDIKKAPPCDPVMRQPYDYGCNTVFSQPSHWRYDGEGAFGRRPRPRL